MKLSNLAVFDSPEDAYRQSQIEVWQRYSPQPTVWLSQDDNAWNELRAEASGDLPYAYDNVLGGTENTFGLEIEFEDGDTLRHWSGVI